MLDVLLNVLSQQLCLAYGMLLCWMFL